MRCRLQYWQLKQIYSVLLLLSHAYVVQKTKQAKKQTKKCPPVFYTLRLTSFAIAMCIESPCPAG